MSDDKLRINWDDINQAPPTPQRPAKTGPAAGGAPKGGLPPLHPAPKQQTEEAAARMKLQSVLLIAAMAVALLGLILAARGVAAHERAFANMSGPIAPSGPANVCMVIDRSGSMAGAPLADAKEAAKDFLKSLKIGDEISIVHFGSGVTTALAPQEVKTADDTSGAGPIALRITTIQNAALK